jgi:hypothetical protein
MIFGPEVCSVSKPEPLFDARTVDLPLLQGLWLWIPGSARVACCSDGA